jgi:hypothetical protein
MRASASIPSSKASPRLRHGSGGPPRTPRRARKNQ